MTHRQTQHGVDKGGLGLEIDEAYTRRMMVEWRCFKERQMERQQEQVLCTECGKDLAKGSLVTHRQT